MRFFFIRVKLLLTSLHCLGTRRRLLHCHLSSHLEMSERIWKISLCLATMIKVRLRGIASEFIESFMPNIAEKFVYLVVYLCDIKAYLSRYYRSNISIFVDVIKFADWKANRLPQIFSCIKILFHFGKDFLIFFLEDFFVEKVFLLINIFSRFTISVLFTEVHFCTAHFFCLITACAVTSKIK